MSNTREVWDLAKQVAKNYQPASLNSLNAAATSEQISEAENALGIKFPSEYVDFLKIHNGTTARREAKFFAVGLGKWMFVPLSEMAEKYRSKMAMLERDGATPYPIKSERGVKAVIWSKGWIPIADDGSSSLLCIDFDPASGGKEAQLIEVDNDEDDYSLVASSFRDFLSEQHSALKKKVESLPEKKPTGFFSRIFARESLSQESVDLSTQSFKPTYLKW